MSTPLDPVAPPDAPRPGSGVDQPAGAGASAEDGRLPSDSIGGADERPSASRERRLGDFTVGVEIFRLVPLSLIVGALSAGVALGLLDLIGLLTHLAYYDRLGVSLVSPSLHRFGALTLFIPVIGGGIVGLMARYGSEQIRGHGIPEAMEKILLGGSRIEPRLAILKPISSAVSIGSGGPFGAEGPIILTGGAVGSVLAQFFHLAAIERRALLVAGACGGMAAVFGTPVAAVLFGVELLVFEWKPRSMVPIAISVAVAETLRGVFAAHGLLTAAPLFPVPPHGDFHALAIGEAVVIGLVTGALAWVLTAAVYGAEDAFKKLPIHWAWWPPIGGLVVGLGGLVDPRALGVGYGVIGAELAGRIAITGLLLLLVVKLVIWSVALGSGTSGGILAPLLMIGAAAGGIVGHGFGGHSSSTWALLGMGGTLAGVTRSPFTAIIFSFELTHDTGSLLPLLVVCTVAHLLSTLTLRRSILTEKVARRGFHVMREYSVDPLEALFVREVMIEDLITLPLEGDRRQLGAAIVDDPIARRQRLFPVTEPDGAMVGVVAWSDLTAAQESSSSLEEVIHRHPVVAYPDETLRQVADSMAHHGLGALPVVPRDDPRRVAGIVTQFELMQGRRRQLEEERHRERTFTLYPGASLPRR